MGFEIITQQECQLFLYHRFGNNISRAVHGLEAANLFLEVRKGQSKCILRKGGFGMSSMSLALYIQICP